MKILSDFEVIYPDEEISHFFKSYGFDLDKDFKKLGMSVRSSKTETIKKVYCRRYFK